MQALKLITIAMGILIVLATGVLAVLIVHRLGSAPPAGPVTWHQPAGTRIIGLTQTPSGLAVALTGGGPDRIVLLDPAFHERARLVLAP